MGSLCISNSYGDYYSEFHAIMMTYSSSFIFSYFDYFIHIYSVVKLYNFLYK